MAPSPPSYTLLFNDLPPKTFVGIDLISFNSSPNFRGITNIPRGLHFVYTGTDTSLSVRHGRWINLSSPTIASIHTLTWSPTEELLQSLHQSQTPSDTSSRGLVDYTSLCDATSSVAAQSASQTGTNTTINNTSPSDFPALSSYISLDVIIRVLPPSWSISSISTSPRDNETANFPTLTQSAYPPNSHLELLDIDLQRTWAEGDVGRVRTERARDRSWFLMNLMHLAATGDANSVVDGHNEARIRQDGAREILGELQFCFLMVLTLANYSCFEQWKRILTVVLTCKAALGEVEGYFVEVLKILELQLRHADDVDGGLFELRDEVGSGWLRGLLDGFEESVRDFGRDKGPLKNELTAFEDSMREVFGWQEKRSMLRRGMLELEDGERVEVSMKGVDKDEEKGEYAPVVVDL